MDQRSARAAPATPIPLRILGSGEYLPVRGVPSASFDARWGKPEGWTAKHVGIDVRHHAGPDETSSFMAAAAAIEALQRAGLHASDLDCVVSACSVMEQPIPCLAVLVHQRLGLEGSGIPAFDINATCLSFVTALDLVAAAIATGRYRRVLIVTSEIASAGLDWDDPDTAPLFGDGAAAFVVGAADASEGSALLGAHMETYSEGATFCQLRAGGTRLRVDDDVAAFTKGAHFEMSGRAIYGLAIHHLPGFMERLFVRTQTRPDQLARVVPHQASGKALDHLARLLGPRADTLVRIIATHGNQIAASIPIALHHAIVHGGLARGDRVALIGTGAGLSFGGAVLRY